MRKQVMESFCALGLLVGATSAFAGAYGEPAQTEEMPAAPAAPLAVVEEEGPDYARVGPYIGIGGVYAVELFDENKIEDDFGGGAHVEADNSSGFNVRAGYRVHPNVAVEALYENYLQFNIDAEDNLGDRAHARVGAWSTTANVKGYVLTGRWQPYAVVGLGYLSGDFFARDVRTNGHFSSTEDGFMMRFGVGMDACIDEHWAMGPEIAYVLPFGDVEDFDFLTISAGVRYKF